MKSDGSIRHRGGDDLAGWTLGTKEQDAWVGWPVLGLGTRNQGSTDGIFGIEDINGAAGV